MKSKQNTESLPSFVQSRPQKVTKLTLRDRPRSDKFWACGFNCRGSRGSSKKGQDYKYFAVFLWYFQTALWELHNELPLQDHFVTSFCKNFCPWCYVGAGGCHGSCHVSGMTTTCQQVCARIWQEPPHNMLHPSEASWARKAPTSLFHLLVSPEVFKFWKCQFLHKIYVHDFGAPLPSPPNQQSDGFHLEFVLKDLKQNREQSAKIASEPWQNCQQTELYGRVWSFCPDFISQDPKPRPSHAETCACVFTCRDTNDWGVRCLRTRHQVERAQRQRVWLAPRV